MRKLITIILLLGSLPVFAQTGQGWKPQNIKPNYRDSAYYHKDVNFYSTVRLRDGFLRIGLVTITANGTELNILDGALVNTTELNHLVGVTSGVQGQINTINARFKSFTTSLSAGSQTDVTLTGIITEPYSVNIFDADGNDITHSVKDSTALSGGVYHTWIYSTDALTGVKIKVLW